MTVAEGNLGFQYLTRNDYAKGGGSWGGRGGASPPPLPILIVLVSVKLSCPNINLKHVREIITLAQEVLLATLAIASVVSSLYLSKQ